MSDVTVTIQSGPFIGGDIVQIDIDANAIDGTASDVIVRLDDGGAGGSFDNNDIELGDFVSTYGATVFYTIPGITGDITIGAVDLNTTWTIGVVGNPISVTGGDQPQNANLSFDVTHQDEGYSVNISVAISDNGNGSVFQMTLDDDGRNGRFDWPFDAASGFGSITITATEGQTYDFIYTLPRPTLAGTAITIELISDTVNAFFLSATYTNGTQNITATNNGRTGAFAAGF